MRMVNRSKFVAGAMAAAVLLCACEVHAEPTASERVLAGFARCRAIQAPEARAACFDASARELEVAVKTKDITIVDRQEVRKARKSLFGFTLPRIGLFDGADRDERGNGAPDEIKELQTTVVSVRPAANGRVELRVAEGDALWTTTDPMPFPPKAGQKVRIRRGALGNYFIAVEGQKTVRGMRLR